MAPDSGSFMCRSGATLFLKGIRYDNAALTDITNSVTISSTQSFRRIFPTP
jgi:hypothetical protein